MSDKSYAPEGGNMEPARHSEEAIASAQDLEPNADYHEPQADGDDGQGGKDDRRQAYRSHVAPHGACAVCADLVKDGATLAMRASGAYDRLRCRRKCREPKTVT